MTLAQGTEQNIKDWYGFYKSINTRNNNNKWLIDIALDYYENKMIDCNTDKHHKDNKQKHFKRSKVASNIIPSVYSNTNNNTNHNSI